MSQSQDLKPLVDAPNTLAPSRSKRDDANERSMAKGDVPSVLLDRYLIERDRQGRAERFFRDHRTNEPAFRDTGRSLTTPHAYPDTVADMLKVAQHRGWTRITVRGEEAFRRDVWIQGQALGLEVAGYRPRDRDRQAAGPAGDRPAQSQYRDPSRGLEERLRRAATVVRAMVTDPDAQRRLMEHAAARVGLARSHDRGEPRPPGHRERER